jgi:hypothetical protein
MDLEEIDSVLGDYGRIRIDWIWVRGQIDSSSGILIGVPFRNTRINH